MRTCHPNAKMNKVRGTPEKHIAGVSGYLARVVGPIGLVAASLGITMPLTVLPASYRITVGSKSPPSSRLIIMLSESVKIKPYLT